MGNQQSGQGFNEVPTTGKGWLLKAWILEARVRFKDEKKEKKIFE